ncbi:exocyst complex component 8 [Copidosoma floridanum]|uniref:exocyst complex component 8 n=1 Tax=Copidosoma floridanum TaxID=29053 RepID=UPI0006C96335|nr:exocyst complex component 8 [Copidosoma floridanum]
MHKTSDRNSLNSHYKLPDWLIEVIEDLDSCIAQRHFEDAIDLLKKSEEYLDNSRDSMELYDIKLSLNNRTTFLVHTLTNELELIAESKSLQGGGYRFSKKAVKLLTQLHRCTQASQLYLMVCSATLKARLEKVKRDGATSCYIKRLSSIAISNISEMLCDFLDIFSHTKKCTSALVIWCSHELKILTTHLSKQMFLPHVSLNALGECLTTIRSHCEQMIHLGIDIRYQFDIQLRSTLAKTLSETKEKYMDSVKIRSLEDNWRPSNFESPQNFYKLKSELEILGIPMLKILDINKYSIPLTSNTLAFSKLYIGIVEDCLNIYVPEIIITVQNVLLSILQIQLQHLLSSLSNCRYKQQIPLIRNNMLYFNVLIDRTLELYRSVVGYQFDRLYILKKKFSYELKQSSMKPQPAPRNSVTKYSTIEYI